MKMTKKIALAAMAVLSLAFVGCNKEIGDINWSGALGSGDGTTTFKVKQTNETDSTIRGMKRIGALNRAKGTCVVRQFDQSNKTCDGMVGFATCVIQNKGKDDEGEKLANYGTYNFIVVGVRNNKGTTETYASYYCNIAEDQMSTNNFGAGSNTKTTFDPDCTDAYEIELVKFPKVLSSVNINDADELVTAIQFVGYDDGSVEINWYKEGDFEEKTASAICDFLADPVFTCTVDAAKVGRDADSEKGSLWTYANIYGGETLNARWDIYDVSWKQEAALSADEIGPTSFGDIDWN